MSPKIDDKPIPRPRAFEKNSYPWNMKRVSSSIMFGGKSFPHPARQCGVFVVHGMGTQGWTGTAAILRGGFEDALDKIQYWQKTHPASGNAAGMVWPPGSSIPPPFVLDGYWGDYDKIAETFLEDWKDFDKRERSLFSGLWKTRVRATVRTFAWLIGQQMRLLRPNVLLEVGPLHWSLYVLLQPIMFAFLLFALIRHPRIIADIMGDVRLYVEPKGVIEKAIVQRIDRRVGEQFLRMIGLGWDFLPLQKADSLKASGEEIVFDRVIWVAHSLGTVISYNVLSDLFHRAELLSNIGNPQEKLGVARFRESLKRFVTLGSPLDKIAFLFGEETLRPWPVNARRSLITGGESLEPDQKREDREWWVNFYHVLDPVSGALSHPLICGTQPPANLHIKLGHLPGLAHIGYWRDLIPLRFILGRTYGAAYLPDKPTRVWSAASLTFLALFGYLVWAVTLMAPLILVLVYLIYFLCAHVPAFLEDLETVRCTLTRCL